MPSVLKNLVLLSLRPYTVEVLKAARATLMFGDTHTLRAMPPPPPPGEEPLALRAGVVKIGSGSSFLPGVTEVPAKEGSGEPPLSLEWGGIRFHAFGKALA